MGEIIPKTDRGLAFVLTDAKGNKNWYKNNKLHREDGPAVEHANGDKEWWINGKRHREDGPAIEWASGNKCKWWYINGKLHREDGPAIETKRYKERWLNNKRFEYKDYLLELEKINSKTKDKKATVIKKSKPTTNSKMKNDKDITSDPKIKIKKFPNRTEYYYNDYLHREDGPAIEFNSGGKCWYINGKRHREDGPAVDSVCGEKIWYKNGKYHREDGPAVEHTNGEKYWYKEGKLHREGGPAIECANGDKEWWINGKRHREDGPAIEWAKNGFKEWRLNGRLYKTEKGFFKALNKLKNNIEVKVFANRVEHYNNGKLFKIEATSNLDIFLPYYIFSFKKGDKVWYKDVRLHRDDGPAVEYANGDKYWYKNGNLHREDGPAIEDANGYKAWYINNLRHRKDGPAVEYIDGSKEWWIDGKMHKEDGPAIEYVDGRKEWCINGQIHREDAPAIEWANGDKEWFINGERHREDGPAVEYANGDKVWYINGKQHRIDRPAVEYETGEKKWWLEGKDYTEEGFIAKTKPQEDDSTYVKAGYRIASTQITKAVKATVITLIKAKADTTNSKIISLLDVLDSDIGEAIISSAIGYILTFSSSDNEKIAKIASELRICGITKAGNYLINDIVQSISPIVMDFISPANDEKIRVNDNTQEFIENAQNTNLAHA